ncbi:MAG: galactose-1-phosphate uridylyltransferase, partial [Candidatus Omnitrophica bacterium]|nr:galactose-1-phosphate uridylyltransferase [Candidatus Omnitrophota bacterium]
MSELRYNMISRDWVIIARERAKRPSDFKKAKGVAVELPAYEAACPFCAGNEGDCKDETFRVKDGSSWKVRAVYNKFPALSPALERTRTLDGPHHFINGFGVHEVLVEHPRHNMTIPFMKDEEVFDIIRMYKDRYEAIQRMGGIESIIIFKNHGAQAGSSQAHAHSQLVATPIVPPAIRTRVEQATRYSDITGECMFCGILKQELSEKARLVLETDSFVTFVPY